MIVGGTPPCQYFLGLRLYSKENVQFEIARRWVVNLLRGAKISSLGSYKFSMGVSLTEHSSCTFVGLGGGPPTIGTIDVQCIESRKYVVVFHFSRDCGPTGSAC